MAHKRKPKPDPTADAEAEANPEAEAKPKGKAPAASGPNPKAASSLYGNLDLLVLRTIEMEGPTHGLGVMDAIERSSDGSIEVEDGALYRSLHRLEARGLLSARWRTSEKNRKAKFYSLTKAGRKELIRAREEWERHARAVGRVLGLDWGGTS
jgi:transcriptional regulator